MNTSEKKQQKSLARQKREFSLREIEKQAEAALNKAAKKHAVGTDPRSKRVI
jgi:hypothetical protein